MAMAHRAQNPVRRYEKGLIIMLFHSCQLAYEVFMLLLLLLTPFYKTKKISPGQIASLRPYY